MEPDMNSLHTFARAMHAEWGPLSDDLVAALRTRLEALLRAPATEDWLAALVRRGAANQELYRDPDHGFVLLAHTEPTGLYRPPHDHGRSWVAYGIQRGVSEMTTYAKTARPDGSEVLVKRDCMRLKPGMVQVYLPGDIHDTRCVEGPALIYRFTERDLKHASEQPRIARFVPVDGEWVAP